MLGTCSRWAVLPLVLLLLSHRVQATALTAMLAGSERSCYYADVDGTGEKIGFYFAVQSGGNFDVDFVVMDPDDKLLLEGSNEKQGDYIFTANKIGEYSFCFENEASMSDKLLDFDIMVESEPRRALSAQQAPLREHTSTLEESTYKISGLLSSITRSQKYFHTRHHRNYSTVLSTQSRIFWFTVLESVIVIGMSILQIWVLKTFFSRSGRRYKV
ncbi:emp24/gp25L/p24 family/GOLD-domain-containing protein [Naematelia encephala]|uniref:Emp24/gp25L/p24 family/GOLD-domain-containing protein n=1 Tax=Naematelia encephala TaxID=71784 RepID=A0A1Y2BJ14_9TREE|nr:emp24/gp25L/p24 family/GOLD-domain-containing protein [Naematelia encephala]